MDIFPPLEEVPEYVEMKNNQEPILLFTCKHGFEFKISNGWNVTINEVKHSVCGCYAVRENKLADL